MKNKKTSEIKVNEFGYPIGVKKNAKNLKERCAILDEGIESKKWRGEKLKKAQRLLNLYRYHLGKKTKIKKQESQTNGDLKTKIDYQMTFGRIALIQRDIAALEQTNERVLDAKVQQDILVLVQAYRAEIRVLEGAITRWEKATGNQAFRVTPIAEASKVNNKAKAKN